MSALTPIRVVADHFELAISTLHYWERRGLISPQRRGGQRCYDADQLYRIALIKLWRTTGLMSIDEIAAMLDAESGWQDTVPARIAEIERQQAALEAARDYLNHLLGCRHESGPDRCPRFRAAVDLP
ncbi:MerR family transcriptional regulator [Saccharopolyspora sp. NPDC050642]|uniref:MerR family transcriptional regulator n=1 Tax=Saccharopolyspora sp. NPDC050642 TaxID=3157099 RepID=UPI00340F1A9C